jgi:magnesium and cobalt transporter
MSEQEGESKSWLEKLSLAMTGEPSSRSELVELLRSAEQRDLLDGEALRLI